MQQPTRINRDGKSISPHIFHMSSEDIDLTVRRALAQKKKARTRRVKFLYAVLAVTVAALVWISVYYLTGFNVLNQR